MWIALYIVLAVVLIAIAFGLAVLLMCAWNRAREHFENWRRARRIDRKGRRDFERWNRSLKGDDE